MASMPNRFLAIRSVVIDGKPVRGVAALRLVRTDPTPRVKGPPGWSVAGRTDRALPLPDDVELTITLVDGRVLTGNALCTTQWVTSSLGDIASTYEYQGKGPLGGLTPSDYD